MCVVLCVTYSVCVFCTQCVYMCHSQYVSLRVSLFVCLLCVSLSIQIYNIDNGERFTTYAIRAERGSKIFSLNGAAAHKGSVGDRVIICAYATVAEQELDFHKPRLIYMDAKNNITAAKQSIEAQPA